MKRKMIIIAIIVFLLSSLFIIYRVVRNANRSVIDKVVSSINKSNNRIEYITKIDCDNKDDLSCTEKANFYNFSDMVIATISKYNSDSAANMYENFIAEKNTIVESFKDRALSFDKDYYNLSNEGYSKIIIKGSYIIQIKNEYDYNLLESIEKEIDKYNTSNNLNVNEEDLINIKNARVDEYKKYLEDLNNNKIEELNNDAEGLINKIEDKGEDYSQDDINSLNILIEKYEEIDELESIVKKLKDERDSLESYTKEVKKEVNGLIKKAEKSLKQKDYDELVERVDEIKELTNGFYTDDISNWEKSISKLEKNVFIKSCKKYKYKELLRNPDDYYDNHAYFFGKVLQKVSSTEYRVGVNCHKFHYIKGYYCDDTIYMEYYGETSLIEDDMIKIYGTMSTLTTYESIMGAHITIPTIEAKYVTRN